MFLFVWKESCTRAMMENLPQVEWEMVEATQMFPIHEGKHETPRMGRIKVDTRSSVILR